MIEPVICKVLMENELLSQFSALCDENKTSINSAFVAFAKAALHDKTVLIEAVEEARVELIVGNCIANQRFEGLEPSEEDIAACRRVARGETTAEEEVAKILAKYKKN